MQPLFICLFALALAIVGRSVFRTFANPLTMVVAAFALPLIPMILFAPELPFTTSATVYLALAMSAFGIGIPMGFRSGGAPSADRSGGIEIHVNFQRLLRIVFDLMIVYMTLRFAFLYRDIVVLGNGEVNGVFYRETYFANPGLIERVGQFVAYACALVAGIWIVTFGWRNVRVVLYFAIAVATAVVTVTKLESIISVIVIISVVVCCGESRLQNRRRGRFAAGALAAIGMLLLVLVVQSRRSHGKTGAVITVLRYLSSSYSAFSVYLTGGEEIGGPKDFGASIYGLKEVLLGADKRGWGAGYLGQSFPTSYGIVDSNVYTGFVPMIRDFTYVGSLVALCVIAFVIGVLWSRGKRRRASPMAALVCALFVTFAMVLPIMSLTYFNTFFGLIAVAVLIARVCAPKPTEGPVLMKGRSCTR